MPIAAGADPVTVSDPAQNSTCPRIARGAAGRFHVVYHRTKPDWRVCYRGRAADGTWGPIEVVTDRFSCRADVAEDAAGRVHVVCMAEDAGKRADLVHAVRENGAWKTEALTSTADLDEDEPRMGVDSRGRIHLVYTRSPGKGGQVCHRAWENGAWSAETMLGHVDNSYYHRPDISVDAGDRVHVVWCARGGTRNQLLYRRLEGGAWSEPVAIGASVANDMLAYPKIAAATAKDLVAVSFDEDASGVAFIRWTCSRDGGATWSAFEKLNPGHYPSLDGDGRSAACLVYEEAPKAVRIGLRRWIAAGWSDPLSATPETRWQGWPDVAAGADGRAFVVCDDAVEKDRPDRITCVEVRGK